MCANAQKGEKRNETRKKKPIPRKRTTQGNTPHQRLGLLYRGKGRGYRGTDPSKCARFPWLRRWCWADPESEDVPADPASEKRFLENQVGYLDKDIEQIKNRLEEIGEKENQ
jgi:hypothetical protein